MARNNLGSPFAGTLAVNDAGSDATNIDPNVYQGMMDVSSARTILQELDEDTYTDEKLDAMTRNDMVYAIRVALQPDSFIQPPLTEAAEYPPEDGNGDG